MYSHRQKLSTNIRGRILSVIVKMKIPVTLWVDRSEVILIFEMAVVRKKTLHVTGQEDWLLFIPHSKTRSF